MKLYTYCVLYVLACFAFNLLTGGCGLNVAGGGNPLNAKDIILKTVLVFSHNGFWFVSCYLALFLMAPVLNVAIRGMTRKQYLTAIILFTVVNEYFGYFWKNEYFNVDGYNVAQFVYLYLIGGYIGKYISAAGIKKRRWFSLGVYLSCSVLYGILSVVGQSHYVPHWDGWKYNNPVLIAGAVFFLLFFLSFDFKSRLVNHVAKSCLGIYLAQNFIAGLYLFVGKNLLDLSNGCYIKEVLLVLPSALAFMLQVILFDQVRIPVQGMIMNIYDRCSSFIRSKV